jgi:molybdopterin molybdotransferase
MIASATRTDRLLSVEEARDGVLAAIDGPVEAQTISTADALGRVLAQPVASATALPPWDNSAMDGYALRSADVADATDDRPVRLGVVGEIRAGGAPDITAPQGGAVRIATGAPVPGWANAVVPVEQTTPIDDDGQPIGPRGRDAGGPLPAGCLVHVAVPAGGSIRRAGSDLAAGTMLAEAGTTLSPSLIALIAGAGIPEVAVRRPLRVAVMATGDEVRAPGEPLGAAGIPDANGPGLRALVTGPPVPSRSTWASRATSSPMSRPGFGRLSIGVPTRSSCPVVCPSDRTTS